MFRRRLARVRRNMCAFVKASLEAIVMLLFSSRSVRTWKSNDYYLAEQLDHQLPSVTGHCTHL